MHVEIVMIGTELLLGQIVDTNAAFMGQTLAEHGINLYQKTTVGDNRERIMRALDAALERSDVVLTSGGLGPTEDDITRECIADLCGCPLEFRDDLYAQLEARFAHLRRPISDNNRKQAYAPQGATAIENPNGTAPGLIVESPRGVIICMPGVPGELRAMLTDSVIPYLRDKFGIEGLLHYRVLKVCGMGESSVDAAIGDLIVNQQNPTVGVLASPDAVRIRIAARANTLDEANALIDEVDAQVRQRLPGMIMGVDDETLEGVVDTLLGERGWTLTTVEAATGGAIAHCLTAANARSFVGGTVLASGQQPAGSAHAAAKEMAQAARADSHADCVLATATAPDLTHGHAVLLTPDGDTDWEVSFWSSGQRRQLRTAIVCLEHVRRFLTGARG